MRPSTALAAWANSEDTAQGVGKVRLVETQVSDELFAWQRVVKTWLVQ